MAENLVISIRPTDVKSCSYVNDFRVKPGERVDIQVKTNLAIKTNPAQPTNAVVFVKFEASDPNKGISLQIETITAVVASTFVDDFEAVIRDEYINMIMLAVNERIRSVASNVGFNITVPGVNFGASNGSVVNFDSRKSND